MTGPSRIELARQLLVAGDLPGARRASEVCLSAPVDAKEKAGAHMILAACCRRESDQKGMLEHATKAVAAAPGDALAHYALAECVDKMGDKARAIAELHRAIGALGHGPGAVTWCAIARCRECRPCDQKACSMRCARRHSSGSLEQSGYSLASRNRLAGRRERVPPCASAERRLSESRCISQSCQDQGHPDVAEATLRALFARPTNRIPSGADGAGGSCGVAASSMKQPSSLPASGKARTRCECHRNAGTRYGSH